MDETYHVASSIMRSLALLQRSMSCSFGVHMCIRRNRPLQGDPHHELTAVVARRIGRRVSRVGADVRSLLGAACSPVPNGRRRRCATSKTTPPPSSGRCPAPDASRSGSVPRRYGSGLWRHFAGTRGAHLGHLPLVNTPSRELLDSAQAAATLVNQRFHELLFKRVAPCPGLSW